MYAYIKSFRNAGHVRRYTIQATRKGWEIREEEDDRLLRQSCYHDWHRVERVRHAFSIEFASLRQEGWQEE